MEANPEQRSFPVIISPITRSFRIDEPWMPSVERNGVQKPAKPLDFRLRDVRR